MRIELIRAAELTEDLVTAWSELQRRHDVYDSPYFRPEFTQAVAAVRDDVEVGVLIEAGRPVGFFPFQRDSRNVARPVGGKLSDFHGVIVAPELLWTAAELLRGCRLSAWHFDHLIAGQTPFQPYHWTVEDSAYFDLSQGWEGYARDQMQRRKETFSRLTRKMRQAERECGPIRFELHTTDSAVLDRLLQWKTEKYLQSGVPNVFGFPWTRALLQKCLAQQGEAFGGMLSALYMQDRLEAALLSIRSFGVLHAWFSAYSTTYSRFSPGMILWMKLIEQGALAGYHRVDLGKGPETYKVQFRSGAISVAEGSVDLRLVTRQLRRRLHQTYTWMRSTRFRETLRRPGRFVRRLYASRTFR